MQIGEVTGVVKGRVARLKKSGGNANRRSGEMGTRTVRVEGHMEGGDMKRENHITYRGTVIWGKHVRHGISGCGDRLRYVRLRIEERKGQKF